MGKKKRKRVVRMEQNNRPKESSYWKIVAVIALVISAGLAVKMMSDSPNAVQKKELGYQSGSSGDDSLETQIQLAR